MKEVNHKSPHILWFHLHEMPRIDKAIEIQSSLAVDCGWGDIAGGGRDEGQLQQLKDTGFWDDENAIKWVG